MFQHVAAVRIVVDDLPAGRDWYARLLGTAAIEDLPDFVSFRVGPQTLDLCRPDAKNPLGPGGPVVYWAVADLNAAMERARGLGATLYRGPLDMPENGTRICQMRDPFGGVFGMEQKV